jgi:hypothetical protein
VAERLAQRLAGRLLELHGALRAGRELPRSAMARNGTSAINPP